MKSLNKFTQLSLTVLLVVTAACSTAQSPHQTKESAQSRLQIAEAMFQERCKKSGEFIHRTADNVEGVYLMKVRPNEMNRGDQFALDDPYGVDVGGEGYVTDFLLGKTKDGSVSSKNSVTNGYHYVEAESLTDGKRYRYTGRIEEPWQFDKSYLKDYTRFVLDKVPVTAAASRYGVTYDDISTHEDREYWIAGSSLKVIDLATKEVMAERIGYMIDRGQGNDSGGRQPWLLATYSACPSFPSAPDNHPVWIGQTRRFVEKILHIEQGM